MNCPACGATVFDGASFCERCGQQVGVLRFNSSKFNSFQFGPQPTKDNKVLWVIVIVVIIAVAAPIVLAAVLYFMVVGYNPDGSAPFMAITERTLITNPNGYKFVMTNPTQTVTWTDFTVILQTGANSEAWDNALQSSLTGSGGMTEDLGAKVLGASGSFFVNVTDVGGNGVLDNGDYFTITGPFASGTTYTVALLYEPTKGKMVDTSWTA